MMKQRSGRRWSWRKAWRAAQNRMRRAARVGNYWYWLDPAAVPDSFTIAELICPLRYDVLVRRDFFTFYAAHRDLYRTDRARFVEQVKQGPYYTWFMTSEAIRCKAAMLGDAAALEDAFLDRLRRAVTLYDRVEAHGFDPRYPIVLKTAERLLPPTTDKAGPPTGKRPSARYFLADGCHRLALLMALGHTSLTAGHFRVKCFREFSPFDSTSLLVRSLAVEPPTYFAYLSSHYGAPFVFKTERALLDHVATHQPARLQEVLSVIRVDGFAGDASLRVARDSQRPAPRAPSTLDSVRELL